MKSFYRIVLFALLLAAMLTACGKGANGIQGKVILGRCTGDQVAQNCTAKSTFSATLAIYDSNVKQIKTVETKGDGSFTIPLKPGTYLINPQPPEKGKFPMAADFKVVVKQGEWTELTIYYDTGER
jgi:hypothetical protein